MAEPNVYWAGTPNYTPGNFGVEALFPHWTCGGFDGSVATLQNPDRQASAHYVIEGGRVAQLVSEDDSAWHCGNYYYNMRAISYELVGWPGNPPSYETLDTCARMMAEASRRYFGGATLVLGQNVMLHKWVYSTDCPGETDIDWLVSRANDYLGGGTGGNDMYAVNVPDQGAEVYRLFNGTDHFYTVSAAERDAAVGFGYTYEGVAWKCPAPKAAVYRLFNGADHFFTTNYDEVGLAVSVGYRVEAVQFFAAAEGTPVYRLYNGTEHFYTTNAAERDKCKADGWNDEGIAFYI